VEITACPKCGSKHIEIGTMGEGVTFGVTSWKMVCRDCGYQGQPLVFDSDSVYNEFLEKLENEKQKQEKTDLKEEISVDDTEDELAELSQKDKEVVTLFKEYDKEKPSQSVWPKNKVWWPEIGLALLLALFAYFSGLTNLALLMGIGIAILYGALNFIFNFVIYLFVIVIIEYFYYWIKCGVGKKNK
jgi:transcription elongation factor Elf1